MTKASQRKPSVEGAAAAPCRNVAAAARLFRHAGRLAGRKTAGSAASPVRRRIG